MKLDNVVKTKTNVTKTKLKLKKTKKTMNRQGRIRTSSQKTRDEVLGTIFTWQHTGIVFI